MSPAVLKTDLTGKIRNIRDFKSEALLPVFEAVVNSIEAIEEAGTLSEGKIAVRILREPQGSFLEGEDALPKITGFEIEDNGIGFNDANLDSFQTSDSTHKLDKGGKGIGRFLWLKAFSRVDIDSVYKTNNEELAKRTIRFTIKDGIRPQSASVAAGDECRTVVRLIGFQESYRKQPTAYKTCQKISQRLFEHCLARFISGLAPSITVIDTLDVPPFNLNDYFAEIAENITSDDVRVGSIFFKVHHIRLYSTRAQIHQLAYCAHGRAVQIKPIGKLLGTSTQFDDEGKKFFYSAYVTSSFLDEHVDTYRQEFTIPENTDMLTADEISMEQLEGTILVSARTHLAEVIKSIERQKSDRVADYVASESPTLRAVVKHCPEVLKEIEPNTSNEQLAQVLYKYKGKAEYSIKQQSEKLLKTQVKSVDDIKAEFETITEKLEDFQKDQLAAFVVFRKLIIDLLEKKLELNKNGKYHNEDIVHDIVFPRKTDTDTIMSKDHNLWLIDEKLAFHIWAGSDKELREVTDSESKDRPDVLVLSEVGDDKQARAVSLLEFKKPQKTKFDEDPTRQLFRYVRQIREKGLTLPTGRPVTVDPTTRFYCYAICDLTPQVIEFAENGNYAKLQSELGFYTYNRTHNAHVEIVAFDKIVRDAKQRHKAFFDKLGIVK
jgi:hypothetical protein